VTGWHLESLKGFDWAFQMVSQMGSRTGWRSELRLVKESPMVFEKVFQRESLRPLPKGFLMGCPMESRSASHSERVFPKALLKGSRLGLLKAWLRMWR
jgi:hypothetical protein